MQKIQSILTWIAVLVITFSLQSCIIIRAHSNFNIIFCDIPWTIKQGGANRLVAVGQDAYLITTQLNRLLLLPNWPIYGSTGALTMTAQHTISRRLLWARFHAGRP